MKIGIVGNGIVGHAIARCYMEHAEVLIYDKILEKSTHGFHPTMMADIIFVCLPETELDKFFSTIDTVPYCGRNFVLKSTVPIGTTKGLKVKYNLSNIVHSPEFLTARCAVTDAQIPARNIIGVPRDGDPVSQGYQTLKELYFNRFPGVPFYKMKSDESEAVKLFTNAFFAVKVAYFNEINLLCEKMGLNWETVRRGMLSDGRIAHSHTQVPGPDGKYGFGGSCLPKDLKMLLETIVSTGGVGDVCWGAFNRNQFDRERT